MDLSTFNAYILFKLKHKNTIQFVDFRCHLIRQLTERYAQPKGSIGRPTIGDNLVRLTARHFPSLVPKTATRKTARTCCILCSHTNRREKKRSDTRYQCNVCKVRLCVIGCFEDYRTLKHFQMLLYKNKICSRCFLKEKKFHFFQKKPGTKGLKRGCKCTLWKNASPLFFLIEFLCFRLYLLFNMNIP